MLFIFNLFLVFSTINITASVVHNNFFDSQHDANKFSYIYAPGFMGSEILMGRYCPDFVASTGERIKWKSGGNVIGSNRTAVTFPEIDLNKPKNFNFNPIKNVLDKFRINMFSLILRAFQEKLNFEVEDNPTSQYSVVNYGFNFSQSNLGQNKDINALKETYNNHLKRFPNKDIIFFGDSRGATTIFNFIARHKPNNVKAAIIEGIYDNIEHCIKHFLYEDKSKEAEKYIHDMLLFFIWSLNPKGPFAIDLADMITDTIPLLFVISLKDGLIPLQSTINIYLKLKKRDFKNIHLLVLDNATHPKYMIDNESDTKKYETTVHAFYKCYNLPHNVAKAKDGKKNFHETNISIEDLKKKYSNLPRCTLCNKDF